MPTIRRRYTRHVQVIGFSRLLNSSTVGFNEFRWEKDGGSIPMYEGVSTRLLDDYSSQLVIERISSKHNGDFTCLATNSAATRKHTATLTVNGRSKI